MTGYHVLVGLLSAILMNLRGSFGKIPKNLILLKNLFWRELTLVRTNLANFVKSHQIRKNYFSTK